MAPFKDEWIFIIAPGSKYTNVQLGLPESFTPPQRRFATRMFPGLNPGEWEPIKIESRQKKPQEHNQEQAAGQVNGAKDSEDKAAPAVNGELKPASAPAEVPDVEMTEAVPAVDASAALVPSTDVNGTSTQPDNVTSSELKPEQGDQPAPAGPEEDQVEYEDDPYSEEGAVYPIVEGRIENWSCFFALISHIWKTMGPHFVSPLILISQPCWTARDKEMITQYFFQDHRIPAFCMMDSALAACYAYGVPSGLIIDVGLDKCDVSAITDFGVNDAARGVALPGCGGRGMTKRLQESLHKKGIDCDETMAEALKRSPVCEILSPGVPMPTGKPAVTNGDVPNPAAAASTGAVDSGADAKEASGAQPGTAPRGPGNGTEVGEEGDNEDDNEGVLDIAAIVAQNNAAEVLAKREAEKVAKAAARKGAAAEALRPIRLRNAEREKATFTYDELLPHGTAGPDASRKRKRDIEVGTERFMAVTPPEGQADGILDTICAAAHATVLGIPDITQRSTLWENLIVLGNGSRVRGFREALIALLQNRYILSPSTATIFTSELPSNFTTPVATPGTNTPVPGQSGHLLHHPGGHGVNPLLVAATRNVMQPNQHQTSLSHHQHHLQVPGSATPVPPDHQIAHHHRGFSQSPTAIKTVKPPEYFPEWKHGSVSGMEEASFLGAQVAGKVIFMVDQGQNKGFMSRTEYNELGPGGIHEFAM